MAQLECLSYICETLGFLPSIAYMHTDKKFEEICIEPYSEVLRGLLLVLCSGITYGSVLLEVFSGTYVVLESEL